MATVTARVEFKETLRALNRFQSQQLPFATSKAINATAKQARTQVVQKTYPQAFNVKQKNFARVAFKIEFSNKRQRPIRAVLKDSLKRAFLPIHVKGGTRTPARSSSLIIPTRNVLRTKTGKVGKAKQPRNLRNTFRANRKGRGDALWQIYGPKKRKRLRLMYVFKPQVPISKAFRIERDVQRIVRRNFPGNMRRQLSRALRSAK